MKKPFCDKCKLPAFEGFLQVDIPTSCGKITVSVIVQVANSTITPDICGCCLTAALTEMLQELNPGKTITINDTHHNSL